MPITSVIFVSRHSTQTENYGSRRRNLDYFRKCRTPARKKQARITEVKARMPITSVIFVSRHSTQTENYGVGEEISITSVIHPSTSGSH